MRRHIENFKNDIGKTEHDKRVGESGNNYNKEELYRYNVTVKTTYKILSISIRLTLSTLAQLSITEY